MGVDNPGVVRSFYDDFVNTGHAEAVVRLVHADVRFFFGGELIGTGPGVFQQTLATLRTAFPDLHTEIDALVACGDTVCERVVTRGTHRGTLTLPGLAPIAASGVGITMHGISMFELRDGRILANWAMPDRLGLLRQLGVL